MTLGLRAKGVLAYGTTPASIGGSVRPAVTLDDAHHAALDQALQRELRVFAALEIW